MCVIFRYKRRWPSGRGRVREGVLTEARRVQRAQRLRGSHGGTEDTEGTEVEDA